MAYDGKRGSQVTFPCLMLAFIKGEGLKKWGLLNYCLGSLFYPTAIPCSKTVILQNLFVGLKKIYILFFWY